MEVNGFWHGKKVLLTGHTGFKGSWLALWLQRLGAHVLGYAGSPPTTPSLFEMARVAEGMVSIDGDVRDYAHMSRIIIDHQPEIIIHMAAQSLVRYSHEHPLETYSTNVIGTAHVLEAARQSQSVRVVVIVTSDKCYENRESPWGYRETERMGGSDPYSSSKGCAELVTAAYRDTYFGSGAKPTHSVAAASARAGNVLGGGDWADDRLVPDVMRAFMAERPVMLRYPQAVRPWQHVLDPLWGYLILAEKLWESGQAYAEAWNFGPCDEDTKPVSWVVGRLIDLWGDGACWKSDLAPHPQEAGYLKLDCSKAKAHLGWSPRLRLSTALEWTVEWYRGYQQRGDMRQVTEEQIARFESEILMCAS